MPFQPAHIYDSPSRISALMTLSGSDMLMTTTTRSRPLERMLSHQTLETVTRYHTVRCATLPAIIPAP